MKGNINRGNRLFNTLVLKENIQFKIRAGNKKGRSIELLNQRNTCIIYRYFFYAKIKKLQFSEILKQVAFEFYLSERTCINIIESSHPKVKKVFAEKKEKRELQSMYPFLNWL